MKWAVALLAIVALTATLDAQAKRSKKPPASTTKTQPAALTCPHVLGQGAATARSFCDVETGTDPLGGAVIQVPPHRGVAVLTFDLHNRHMYSAALVDSGRGYTRATATIGVLAMDGTVLTRALVQTEFRKADDLFDRIMAGAGLSGVKAVAPMGSEPVQVEIPEKVNAVSILGEKLVTVRVDGTETITAGGRPIAVVSNARVQYRPAAKSAKSAKSTKSAKKR